MVSETWGGRPEDTDLGPKGHFVERLYENTKRLPKKVMIIEGLDRKFTYEQIYAQAQYISKSLDYDQGRRIALKLADKPNLFSAIIGVQMSGNVVVCIDTDEQEAILKLVRDSDADLILYEDGELTSAQVEYLKYAKPGLSVQEIRSVDGHGDKVDFDYLPVKMQDDDLAQLFYTSGTTGDRKGVMISHGAYTVPADTLSSVMHYNANIIEFVVGNISHAFPFGRLRALSCLGATTVLENGDIIPQRIIALVKSHLCNAIAAPGAIIMLMLNFSKQDFTALGDQLDLIKVGSQRLTDDAKLELMALFPQTRLVQQYGASEAPRSVFNDLRTAPNLSTTGKILTGYELTIRDESGKIVETGQKGRVWLRGKHVASGYWGRPEKTASAFQSGWYLTDDFGQIDEDGYLTLLGRVDEVINFGGKKLTPTDVEEALQSALEGQKFVIFGIDDPSGIMGNLPAIVFEVDNAGTALEIFQEWRRMRVSIIKQIGKLAFMPKTAFQINKIPVTKSGKYKRKQLSEAANRLMTPT